MSATQDEAARPAWRWTLARVLLAWVGHLLLVLALTVVLYGALSSVFDGLDEALLRASWVLYSPEGAVWAERISLLGQPYVAVPLLCCGLGIVFVYGSLRDAWYAFLVYFFAGADYLVLAEVFGRPRPHLFQELPEPVGFGTPSGHSTATMALFATIALLLWRHRGRAALPVVLPCVVTFLLVGAARVYLQVHYPTDVLLAWVMTGTWMWLCDRVMPKTIDPAS